MHPLPEVMAITDDELLSVALTSEVCIKLRPETQLGIKVYLGHIHKGQLESYESLGDNFLVVNVYYTYRPLFVTAQLNAYENAGAKIGLGYRLH